MTPHMLLNVLVGIAVVVITISMIFVIYRAVSTRNDARRAFLSDIIFMTMVALFLCFSLIYTTQIVYQVAIFTGLMGALSTIAYARIITRGRR